jgi:hypothetical protein
MNLRKWNKEHTLGLLLALVLPLALLPLVVYILAASQSYPFDFFWDRFQMSYQMQSKVLSLSILANLGVFYLFLNKEKYNFAMGIILGSMLFLPVILYLIFFA